MPVSAIDSTDSCTLMIHYIARGPFAPLDEAIAWLNATFNATLSTAIVSTPPHPLPQRHDKMDSLLSYTFSFTLLHPRLYIYTACIVKLHSLSLHPSIGNFSIRSIIISSSSINFGTLWINEIRGNNYKRVRLIDNYYLNWNFIYNKIVETRRIPC